MTVTCFTKNYSLNTHEVWERVLRDLPSQKDDDKIAESIFWFEIYKLNLEVYQYVYFTTRRAEMVWNVRDLPILAFM